MPEVLWKSFIDFETLQGETEKARKLYERLLERTNHFKVLYYNDMRKIKSVLLLQLLTQPHLACAGHEKYCEIRLKVAG